MRTGRDQAPEGILTENDSELLGVIQTRLGISGHAPALLNIGFMDLEIVKSEMQLNLSPYLHLLLTVGESVTMITKLLRGLYWDDISRRFCHENRDILPYVRSILLIRGVIIK